MSRTTKLQVCLGNRIYTHFRTEKYCKLWVLKVLWYVNHYTFFVISCLRSKLLNFPCNYFSSSKLYHQKWQLEQTSNLNKDVFVFCPCPSWQNREKNGLCSDTQTCFQVGSFPPFPRTLAALSHFATSMNSFRRALKDWDLSLVSPLCLLTWSLTNKEKWETSGHCLLFQRFPIRAKSEYGAGHDSITFLTWRKQNPVKIKLLLIKLFTST